MNEFMLRYVKLALIILEVRTADVNFRVMNKQNQESR